MSLSATPLTAVSAFTANLYPPQAGTPINVADIEAGEQVLLNRTEFLKDTKYDKTGGTITGNLAVTGTLDVDGAADIDGALTVDGLTTINDLLTIEGPLTVTGSQPASTADPGANNRLHATNLIKAWGEISVISSTVTVLDGYNVSAAIVSGGDTAEIVITMARAMANANYAITYGHTAQDGNADRAGLPRTKDGSKSTTQFGIKMRDVIADADFDFSAAATHKISFFVLGRQ